jgi:hypothetical protein
MLDRIAELTGLMRDESEEMNRAGLVRPCRENLMTLRLGFEQSAGKAILLGAHQRLGQRRRWHSIFLRRCTACHEPLLSCA